jgi:hypothetical protein
MLLRCLILFGILLEKLKLVMMEILMKEHSTLYFKNTNLKFYFNLQKIEEIFKIHTIEEFF